MFYFTFPLVWGLFYFNIFYLVWAWSSLLQHCWIEVFSVFGSSTLARPRWLDPMARPCWLSSMYSKFFGFFLSNTTFATSLVHGNIFVCYIILYVVCYHFSTSSSSSSFCSSFCQKSPSLVPLPLEWTPCLTKQWCHPWHLPPQPSLPLRT